MSDSELSDAPPSDDVLEQELRQIVRDTYKKGNLTELTVKRVRAAAEKSLGLSEGFYKSEAWKTRSKDLIESEVQAQEKAPTKATTPSKPSSSKPTPSKPAAKRKSPDEPREAKRQKPNTKPKKPKAPAKVESSSELSDADSDAEKGVALAKDEKQTAAAQEESESEMSEVIDEGPKPAKKRRKKEEGGKSKASKPAKPAKSPKAKKQSKTKPAADADPNAEEIKKLQGWLAKCGIRKVWGKELKPYETSREKIGHLKSMLDDVGMTGRYSTEKAQRIREMRELQADLEAVQEGAKYWGKSDDEDDRGARRKRLARGAKPTRRIVDSGDEEEAHSDAEKPKAAAVQPSDDDSDD